MSDTSLHPHSQSTQIAPGIYITQYATPQIAVATITAVALPGHNDLTPEQVSALINIYENGLDNLKRQLDRVTEVSFDD